MRPASITIFDRLFLGSLVLGLVNAFLSYDATIAQLEADPAVADIGLAGPGFVIATMGFGFGISLLLWFLISRKAVGVAKWVLVVLTVIGLLGMPMALAGAPLLQAATSLGLTVMQLAAIWFLFRPDAKAWFAHGPGGMDPATFD
jgi:hypothetical protein